MNTEHTPEPWKLTSVQKVRIASRGWFVDDPRDGSRIAFVFGEQSEELRANARRVVACVNACKGYDTEDIEACGVRLRDDNSGYQAMREQRDELLAALETLLFAARDGAVLHRDAAHAQARAAIAKVKGDAAA